MHMRGETVVAVFLTLSGLLLLALYLCSLEERRQAPAHRFARYVPPSPPSYQLRPHRAGSRAAPLAAGAAREVEGDLRPPTAEVRGAVHAADGSCYPGAQVVLAPGRAGIDGRSTHTDASGRYEFPEVEPATYDLYADVPGHHSTRYNVFQVVGGVSYEKDISLYPAGDSERAARSRAAESHRPSPTPTPEPERKARAGPGRSIGASARKASARRARDLRHRARTAGTVKGTVVDLDGNPVGFVQVFLEPIKAGRRILNVMTGENGEFRFHFVEIDTYNLYAFQTGYVSDRVENINVDPGATSTHVIRIFPDVKREEIVVVDWRSKRYEQIEVEQTAQKSVIDSAAIERLPLQNRRIQDIVYTFAGVSRTGSSDSNPTTMSGGVSARIEDLVDGANFDEVVGGGPAGDVSSLAIERFELVRGGLQADYSSGSPHASRSVWGSAEDLVTAPAQSVLAERESLEGLEFERPFGYWENTYLPGDPKMRVLASRLRKADRDWLRRADGSVPPLAEGALPYRQPFDEPRNAALALYVHADRRGIRGPSRMLVQVGLRGTSRRGGRQPERNVGLVLDLRDRIDPEEARGIRALVDAFVRARRAGDRFCLAVAGRPGGVVVPASEFRHGPVSVALERLLAGEEAGGESGLELAHALWQAKEEVGTVAKADAPSLGARELIVIAAGDTPWRGDDGLSWVARESGLQGIPVSVIGVGERVPFDEIEELVMAAQGSRWLLGSAAEADALVDRALSAISRVVARAVRLRIRLAPHVRLVEVVGAERLEEERVREAKQVERSIDRRTASNLGIRADRGRDEAGIQILIPAFQAGDSHVVLLDVVALRPGRIADVRARYKDLVFHRNGEARAGLSVDRRAEEQQGPLERNVLKNLIARRLSEALRDAGEALGEDDAELARDRLGWCVWFLDALRDTVPGWSRDPELVGDREMAERYLALLDGGAAGVPLHRRYLSDSLRLAGARKLQLFRVER
jgi:hypothetical protein